MSPAEKETAGPLPLVDTERLANTFSGSGGDSAYEIYQQYQRFTDANGYWSNIAREHDLGKSRAQRWDRGSQPAVVETVEVATSKGWTADEWTPTVEAIADLVVSLIASGSLNGAYAPQWSMGGKPPQDVVIDALEAVGVGAVREGNIISPEEHEVALGRALVVAGAPRAGPEALPAWVFDAPPELRRRWLWILVFGQGSRMKDRSPTRDIVRNSPPSYFEDLARLTVDVTGEEAIVKEGRMTVPAEAVRVLEED